MTVNGTIAPGKSIGTLTVGEATGIPGSVVFNTGSTLEAEVDDSGTGSYVLESEVWSIGTGDAGDVIGRAVIVHAGVDDFTSQPTGAAGGRIGCGVIQ